MHPLAKHIQNTFPELSHPTLQVLETVFQERHFRKGERLLNQGTICRDMYFITEGITRSYSIKGDQDITTWFSFPNQFITSFTSFIAQEASYESIEMLTDGVLFRIGRDTLAQIQASSGEISRIVQYFIQQYAIQLEKRLFLIQTHSAAEKYQAILDQEPHLVRDIPNKYLASYLGITRETLSRIRSRIN